MNPQTGQTALSIAQKLGYISVVETLKVSFDVDDCLYDDDLHSLMIALNNNNY